MIFTCAVYWIEIYMHLNNRCECRECVVGALIPVAHKLNRIWCVHEKWWCKMRSNPGDKQQPHDEHSRVAKKNYSTPNRNMFLLVFPFIYPRCFSTLLCAAMNEHLNNELFLSHCVYAINLSKWQIAFRSVVWCCCCWFFMCSYKSQICFSNSQQRSNSVRCANMLVCWVCVCVQVCIGIFVSQSSLNKCLYLLSPCYYFLLLHGTKS